MIKLLHMIMKLDTRDRLRVGRGAARAEDAQETPNQSQISPSILVDEEKNSERRVSGRGC